MPRLRKTVKVHEKTVQNAANVVPLRRPRKPARKAGNMIGHIKIDERVWKVVMRLCKGNTERLEIVSETEVVVHNNKNWRNRNAVQA